MRSCKNCFKSIGRQEKHKIKCCICSFLFHWNCVNIKSSEEAKIFGEKFICDHCQKLRRQSRSVSEDLSDKFTLSTNMDDVKELLDQLRIDMRKDFEKVVASQTNFEKSVNDSLNLCHQKLDDNAGILKKQTQTLMNHRTDIDNLISENKLLNKKLSVLEVQMDENDQWRRSNSLEFIGVPFSDNDNVVDVVAKVATAVGFQINVSMIESCFKIKNVGKSIIVVNFVKKSDKNELLRLRRVKRSLNTSHMGYQDGTPIYINESLTKIRRVLLFNAAKLKRDNDWKYLWVRDGKVFMRKTDTSKICHIGTQRDLDDIFLPSKKTGNENSGQSSQGSKTA